MDTNTTTEQKEANADFTRSILLGRLNEHMQQHNTDESMDETEIRTDGGTDVPDEYETTERHGIPYPEPGGWKLNMVEADSISWNYGDAGTDEFQTAFLAVDFSNGEPTHSLTVAGEPVFSGHEPTSGEEWSEGGLWAKVHDWLSRYESRAESESDDAAMGTAGHPPGFQPPSEPAPYEVGPNASLDEFASESDEPQRVPATLETPESAKPLETEQCDGADGFECGRELVRGEDKIHVTAFGPGSSRAMERRVLCGECRRRQNAVQIRDMPDLARTYGDDELRALRDEFGDILGDMDLSFALGGGEND